MNLPVSQCFVAPVILSICFLNNRHPVLIDVSIPAVARCPVLSQARDPIVYIYKDPLALLEKLTRVLARWGPFGGYDQSSVLIDIGHNRERGQ